MFKFKNTPLEQAFVLSPFFWSWAIVFNVPNSKHVLSRLIAIICVYLIIAYKGELKENLKIKHKRIYVSILLLSFLYYVFLHVYNDGHFDFARVLISTSVFVFLVPERFFSENSFKYLISISSVLFVLFGLYEKHITGVDRIGMLVNSGPYAFVCGLLLISQFYLLISYKNKLNVYINSVLAFGLLYTIYLTETRAIWLGLSAVFIICLLYYFMVSKTKKKYWLLLILPVVFYTVFSIDSVNGRVSGTIYEVNKVLSKSNFNSSSGARLDMWRNGLVYWQKFPLFGVDKKQEYKLIEDSFRKKEMQTSAHYHLTRTDRSSYHNVYIQSLVKGGVLGFALMLLMLIAPLCLISNKTRKFMIGITLFTLISSSFESQFTIYSSCAYFYILLMGFIIHIGHEQRE